jgi:two-component system, cell cycle sensor histidine kinase and response regulator CckA
MAFGLYPTSTSSANSVRILIVEDEGMVAMDLDERLTQMGYEVLAIADTAADAVTMAQSLKVDLILMDIHLRGEGDGIDAAGQLRKTVDVPVIFVTAHADDTTLQRAGQTEPFGYVLKPFDERELRATIEMAMYRHRAERRLRKMERWLSTTMQSIGDGIIATDSEGRITFLNAMGEALTGWSRGEAVGRHLSEVFVIEEEEPSANILPELLEQALHHGLVVNLGENRFLRQRNGERLALDDSIAPIRNDDAAITGCVVIFRDATERKGAEEERRKLVEKMHETQRFESLGVLASGIAHDFNNFLTAVTLNASYGETMSGGNPLLQSCLRDIAVAGERAAQLCNQMLVYAGKGPVKHELIELNGFTRETAHLLELAIGRKSALALDLAGELPPVSADRSQLQQVITNLIINASEALNGRSGEIAVRTRLARVEREALARCQIGANLPASDYVVLEVSDRGCGMSPETLAHIFDPFFTTKFTGRGLGLAAVSGILGTHGGALAVESRLGTGTTFRIFLPPAEAEPQATEEPPVDLFWRGKGRALLIDDEAAIRMAGTAVLRRLGFEVEVAGNGEEGLAKVAELGGTLRLVLLDLTMPKVDGRQVLAGVRETFPDLPVVLMSGYTEHEAAELLQLGGPIAFLQKPFTLRDLVAKVSSVFVR